MRRLLLPLALAACGDSPQHLAIDASCNPLGFESHCAVPWPSSAFEVDDASTPTGRRLAILPDTLPKNFAGVGVDPTMWNLADGFSPAAPMLVAFPGGASADGLPAVDDFGMSTTAASPTVLLDMTTGERVPHFAELDAQAAATPD